jgi:hypothetical protein
MRPEDDFVYPQLVFNFFGDDCEYGEPDYDVSDDNWALGTLDCDV